MCANRLFPGYSYSVVELKWLMVTFSKIAEKLIMFLMDKVFSPK